MIFKDPLDTPLHVHAAFLLGVLSFEMRGLEKGPLILSKGDVGCKEPEKIKIKKEI